VTAAIAFRRAVRADLPAIVAMLADDAIGRDREAAGPPLDPRYADGFAAVDRDPNQLLAVADCDGRVVGCLQLTFIPGVSRLGMWRGQIEGVRIATGYRGDGLGQRMLGWAIAVCRDRGCGLVQLTTDKQRPEALRFYERLGFKATHEGMKLTLARDRF
jgi:ribosomal protein S18 acetylase RimI-like enzyme